MVIMNSKLRAGKLSGIGLIGMNLLSGIILMPFVTISNIHLVTVILQIGFLWFGVSLWIVVKYTMVGLLGLKPFDKVLNSIIVLIALIGTFSIMTAIIPMKELYAGIILFKIMLLVNYLIFMRKIYNLDKNDLRHYRDLQNWAISIIIVALIVVVISVLEALMWRIEINGIYFLINTVPILFFIQLFKHIMLEFAIDDTTSDEQP